MPKKRASPRQPAGAESTALAFGKVNAILAAAGIATIILGYYLLATGSVTLAPLLLVVGYVVLMPLAIIL